MDQQPRFLLLQVRDADDPMREHEVACFARCLSCSAGRIRVFDLLHGAPSSRELAGADVVLLGGSGDYSVAEGGPWLEAALDAMRELHAAAKPTFASCWGFQAMARAMGGAVVTDPSLAEVGTVWLELTPEGERDPVFAPLGRRFQAQCGHQDVVTDLPPGATLLASSDRVRHQAFRFEGMPIYCTQFHPELDRQAIIDRITRYPGYLRHTTARSVEEFAERTPETPAAAAILQRFMAEALGERAGA